MSANVLKWSVVGAVLGALVIAFALRHRHRADTVPDLTHAPIASATKLSFTTPTEIITLEQATDGWRITSPVRAKAVTPAVEALIGRFTALTTDREASPDRSKATELGLVSPEVTVRLIGADAQGKAQEKAWLLGNEGPNGTAFAVEGDPRIYFGPPGLKAVVAKPLLDLRDRSLVAFAPKDARGLFVLRPGGNAWLVERGDEGWKRKKPTEGAADAAVVDGILLRLLEAKALDYVDERRPTTAEGLVTYGLDKPAATVTILLPGDKSETLLVGVAGEGDAKRVYARIAAGGPVMLVDGSILEELQKEP
jgi:hypothetical protein